MEYGDIIDHIGITRRSLTVLRLEGDNVLEYLDRMSTNNLRPLPVNHHQTTVFTNEKGRIVDVADILHMRDSIILVGSEGGGTVLQMWLERFIIMENIKVSNISSDFGVVSLFGKESDNVQNLTGTENQHYDDNTIITTTIDGSEIIYYTPALWRKRIHSMLLPFHKIDQTILSLVNAVNHGGAVGEATRDNFETFRIESGVPKLGHELLPEINPLEAGLKQYISFTKGCYLGQEVIARTDTYQKLQKRLVSMSISSDEHRGNYIGKLFQNDNIVGYTTSSCFSPLVQSIIALGFLKTSINSNAIELRCSEGTPRLPVSVNEQNFR